MLFSIKQTIIVLFSDSEQRGGSDPTSKVSVFLGAWSSWCS